MHLTFEKFAGNPEKVDEIICEGSGKAKFSVVFHNLFPQDGKHSYSMQSYLNLLNEFEFDKPFLLRKQLVVDHLYHQFNIKKTSEDDGVYKFWVFLVEMYDTIIEYVSTEEERKRPKFDNIFAFMNGFPIEKTRVVIVGQDPAPKCESSGFAFHRSDCDATHELVKKFFNNDRQFLQNAGQTDVKPECPKKPFTGKIFDLESWIEQGVMLFNTYLTYGDYSKDLWLCFTKFLVKQLSSKCDGLVFILVSGDANEKLSKFIIYPEEHCVINVYHPANPKQDRQDLKWEKKLPYLNANRYLFQKNKTLIDWESVTRSGKMEKYRNYFESFHRKEELEGCLDSENRVQSEDCEDDSLEETTNIEKKVVKKVKPEAQKTPHHSIASGTKLQSNVSPAKKRKLPIKLAKNLSKIVLKTSKR